MRLFTRGLDRKCYAAITENTGQRGTSVPSGTWQPDGIGVTGGLHIGGDIQAGNSYSIRFVRPDLPGSMITITYYPVEYDENPDEFVVQRQVEWLVCEDPAHPGDTEIWSDVQYDDLPTEHSDSADAAGAEARWYADVAQNYADAHGWDGQPDWSR